MKEEEHTVVYMAVHMYTVVPDAEETSLHRFKAGRQLSVRVTETQG